MPKLILYLLFLKCAPCFAQALHPRLSQPYASAVAYSRHQANAFSFADNPALLLFFEKPHFGFWSEQRYLLPELTAGAFSAALPAGNSRFGLQVQHLGGSQQHQSGVGLFFAQALGKNGSLGAAFYYQSVAAAGYGATAMLGVGLGGVLQLTPQLQSGFSVFHPAEAFGKKGGERLTVQYSLGLGYDLSEEVFLSAQFEKTEGTAPAVQAALSYFFSKKITSRVGVHTRTGQYFFGGGYVLGPLQVHVFGSVQQRLGFSPGLQVLFHPKGKG